MRLPALPRFRSSHRCGRTLPAAVSVLALAVASVPPAGAAASDAAATRPTAVAVRVAEAPTLDGDVLDDPVWAHAQPIDTFWQTTPDDGLPASERTEVRIVYTDTTLYFGIICYDREPGSILASDSRRDASLENTDSVQIVLDTFRDGQNGFVFGTNPAGIEYDGQVAREGQGGDGGPGRQQRGAGGGFNLNWDGAWEVRTRISEIGWSAEFAIPFRTLRYRSGEDTWGLNIQRNIRRRNETAFWARLDRQYNLYRLVDAGLLTGLAVPPQRNLKLSPYALGSATDEQGARARGDADFGADAKWSLTPSLTLDLTVNTDFAQVEVDEEQINLDRFNLFFPEKRPFFLENAGLFAVGLPSEVELFFSRRIGISGDGTVIPIRGGARLTGKAGGINVGLLNMQTGSAAGEEIVPAANFTVARVSRDLRNRSSVGALFTGRRATGSHAAPGDRGETYAVDARFGIGRRGTVQGFAARTSAPGASGRQHAYSLGGRWESEGLRVNGTFTEVGDGFDPQVGFLARRDFRNVDLGLFRTIRLGANPARLLEIRPHTSYRAYWTLGGFQETGFWHIDSHWAWRAGHEIHTGMNITREGVVDAFEIYPGIVVPPGVYDHHEAMIVAFTRRAAPVSVESRVNAGGFFGGSRVSPSVTLTARAGDAFNTSVSWNRNDVALPWGRFVTNLVRTRVSYSFTPRVYVQGLLQYNDRAQIWSSNLRFGWLQSSNTGLFVVFNDVQDLDDLSTRRVGRSLVVKFSRLFDLLQ
jgi:hypothetical protein